MNEALLCDLGQIDPMDLLISSLMPVNKHKKGENLVRSSD
jgi:hypothetical protein